MKKIYIIPVVLCSLAACNDEVFIKPLSVEPASHTLEWTGGSGEFTANQDIDYVYSIIYRWVNGRGLPVDGRTMQYTLSGGDDRIRISNELCDITLSKDTHGHLTIESGYNLFPDTIYMNIDISSLYETTSRAFRIMPSPGFGHGDLIYDFHQCWYEENADTINLLHMGFFGEQPFDYTVREKGYVLAHSSARFSPYEKLLSDNIFGRDTFYVDEAIVNGPYWGLSGKKIPYISSYQQVSGDSLVFDEDLVISLQPETEYHIKAIIKSEQHGFNYTIKAVSPIKELTDKIIEGIFWIVTPTSYEILIETNEIQPQ